MAGTGSGSMNGHRLIIDLTGMAPAARGQPTPPTHRRWSLNNLSLRTRRADSLRATRRLSVHLPDQPRFGSSTLVRHGRL